MDARKEFLVQIGIVLAGAIGLAALLTGCRPNAPPFTPPKRDPIIVIEKTGEDEQKALDRDQRDVERAQDKKIDDEQKQQEEKLQQDKPPAPVPPR